MKRITFPQIGMLILLPCLLAPLSYASTPYDYAYGAELIPSDNTSMFSQFTLTPPIYLQSVTANLDDVSVFNQAGEPVPFAFAYEEEDEPTEQSFKMIIYPLHSENQTDQADNYALSINGHDIQINMSQYRQPNKAKYQTSYLVQLPNNSRVKQPLANLKLQLTAALTQWQASAAVYTSDDLKNWHVASLDSPLMALIATDKNSTLILNEIPLPPHYTFKNWLITLSSQQPLPELSAVTATTQPQHQQQTIQLPFDSNNQADSNGYITYTLATPQRLNALSIEPSQIKSVLPISLYYKASDQDSEWHKLTDQILRRNDQISTPTAITLPQSGQLIQQLQIRPLNSPINQVLSVYGYRDRLSIIFNSANHGPFILAWGSARSITTRLNVDQLLGSDAERNQISAAYLGEPVVLGGDKALQQVEQSSGIPHWLIWLALVIGAIILVLLGYKLIKEVIPVTKK